MYHGNPMPRIWYIFINNRQDQMYTLLPTNQSTFTEEKEL